MKQWSAAPIPALIAAFLLAGCATVTIRPDGGPKVADLPDYQETKNYFFWGLAGEHTVDVTDICGARDVEQVQSQMTFMNGFLGTLTFGLYAPRTAKVWCDLEGGAQ